ncbi:transglycosylase domain-containing protein [Prosthecomicrobium hirschii]|uniref:transglycosylase domain-containing protein n=1 Tax=Prosthecodimorpha hirschii TaxID=665126 RepID=UPI00221F648E|nr:penicillin-binding protein 1A [Prosthecomicrobium hirschii]MCW1841677.1 penicillin-binding protein 1A [Prosthecomicrobium hirschii]
MVARRIERQAEPLFDDPGCEPDRLDLRLSSEDRPSSVGPGAVRRRAPREAGSGRLEPSVSSYDTDVVAQRDGSRSRGGQRPRSHDDAGDRDEAPPRRRPPSGGAGGSSGGGGSGPRKPAPRRRRSLIGGIVYWSCVMGIWGVIGAGAIVLYYGSRLPPTTEWAVPKRPPNIRIVSSDGTLIGNRGDTGGEAVRLGDLPPYLPKAVMAIEDRRFYSHFGMDPWGLARAVAVNLTSRGVAQGGSTLTQQLAKNLFLTPDRTFGRKVQEVILSLWLEREYSKDQILEMYLNRVYMGAGSYGVDAAARRYFGKSAKQVNVMEAAMLAGLLKAPSRYAPSKNPQLARARAETVLAAMVDAGFLAQKDREAALKAPQTIFDRPNTGTENYVADWVMDLLPAYVGSIDHDIVVETTIDQNLQLIAEAALQGGLAQYGDAKDVNQGALVSVDPSGAVRALVGGVDYQKSQYNRAVTARRQPGSAFKPFVYLAAVETGLTPETVRVDEPVSFKGWSPKNYEKGFRGPMQLKDALAQSINTIAVKLAVEVGPKKVVSVAERLGITSPLQPTAAIALGSYEVTPLEITAAYVPFSNGGYGVSPHVIQRIRSQGKVLYERRGSGIGRVIDAGPLAAMNTMLSETLITGTAKKAQIAGWPAGGKTGTSQDFRDAWFIGYTALLTTGVWLGNDDGTPTKHATGGSIAATVWQRFMLEAHRGKPVADIPGTWRRNQPTVTDSVVTGAVPSAPLPGVPAASGYAPAPAVAPAPAAYAPAPAPAAPYPPAPYPAQGYSNPNPNLANQGLPLPPAPVPQRTQQRPPAPMGGVDDFLKRMFGG